MMSATPGFGRFGSGLSADCFLAAAFPSTALPRPLSAPFNRPFILALACDLGPAILADTILSFLPIHASRRLAYLSLGRRKPTRRSSRPVFNLLFFQVKELPCGATQMRPTPAWLGPSPAPGATTPPTILWCIAAKMHADRAL